MKKELYYSSVTVAEMADWLDLELWGYAPDGRIRVSKAGEIQPTHVMSDEEIITQFERGFELVRKSPGSIFYIVKARKELVTA